MKYAVVIYHLYAEDYAIIHSTSRTHDTGGYFVDSHKVSKDWGVMVLDAFDDPEVEYSKCSEAGKAVDRIANISSYRPTKVYQ